MDYSYAYTHSKIVFYFKQSPRDFVVEEIPLYSFDGEGAHWIVKVRKKNLTTFELIKFFSSYFGVKSSEIGYAGLKDKNGVEIYEGDIVKAKFYGKEVVGEIGFNSGCFLLWNSCVSDNQLFIFTDIEVIGNVWENEVD